MPPPPELPRGWSYFSPPAAFNFNAITIPSAAMISHVLDEFFVKASNKDTVNEVEIALTLDSSSLTFSGLVIGTLILPVAASANSPTIDTDSAASLGLAPEPGESITITAVGTSNPLVTIFFRIQGWDI